MFRVWEWWLETCFGFRYSTFPRPSQGLGIGELVDESIDLPEGIGQKKNSDDDQEDSTDQGDPPHIAFHPVEG